MHKDEWLADAQRLQVGESKRIYHGAESRPNLVIRNEPERWSAYCFHCKVAASVLKHRVETVQFVKRDSINTYAAALAHRLPLSVLQRDVQLQIMKFLISKGMWLSLVEPYLKGVIQSENRLLFNVGTAWLGRDYTGVRQPKWLTYNEGEAYLKGSEILFLTEDVLSAIKIHHMTGVSALALQGTVLKTKHLATVVQHKTVVLAFDSDTAGITCTMAAKKRLQTLGRDVLVAHCDEDLKMYKEVYHGLHVTGSDGSTMELGALLKLHQLDAIST